MINAVIAGDSIAYVQLAQLVEQVRLPSEAEWLSERKTGIGGSDAAVVLNVSPWQNSLQLWGLKTGLLEEEPLTSDAVEMGKLLEPVVLARFRQKSGLEAWNWPGTLIVKSRRHDWLMATPDAVLLDKERGVGLGQIKTTDRWGAKHWKDGPPIYYQVQVQHEMAACTADFAYLILLVDGRHLQWHLIERNELFIDAMLAAESEFWNAVRLNVPPAVVDLGERSNHTWNETVAKLFPRDNGASIMLPAESTQWDAELQAAQTELKAATARKELCEAKLKAAIGDNAEGMLPNGISYSWNTIDRKAYSVAASSYRQLRRSAAK